MNDKEVSIILFVTEFRDLNNLLQCSTTWYNNLQLSVKNVTSANVTSRR